MDRQGGGKLGANQYLPGAKAAGKGHTGCVYGEGGGRGGHRRFYWATLTLVRANLEIGMDKSRSPAFLVWTLQDNQEP